MHDMASVWTREARQTWRADLCLGAVVLRGVAVPEATAIVTALHGITTHAACHWLTATWWSGGGPPDCVITASCRARRDITP